MIARSSGRAVGLVPRRVVRLREVIPVDLALVVVVAIAAMATVLLDGPIPVRIALGLPLILFLPGYALASVFFPGAGDIDGVERIALGFGLSLAIFPLVALFLDGSRWSVTQGPVAVALLLVTAVAGVAGSWRRSRRPESERYSIRLGTSRPRLPMTWDRPTSVGVGLIAIALVLLIVGAVPSVYARLAGQPLTEFAVFSTTGKPSFYPRQIVVGEPVEVQLSVTNREGKPVTYAIMVGGAGIAVDPLPPIALANGETWSGPVRFTVSMEGDQLPVRFELWRGDTTQDPPTSATPYRSLRLLVDGLRPGDFSNGQEPG
jgi:uncharacterized membrane protein